MKISSETAATMTVTGGQVQMNAGEEKDGQKTELKPLIESDYIFIEIHESEIPWLKVFSKKPHKEFSQCSSEEKRAIFDALDTIEKMMLEYYRPEKINIASFGNMLPHLHWHIMARFKEDSYFPEPMWGAKQREASLQLPSFDNFLELLRGRLKEPSGLV